MYYVNFLSPTLAILNQELVNGAVAVIWAILWLECNCKELEFGQNTSFNTCSLKTICLYFQKEDSNISDSTCNVAIQNPLLRKGI